MVVHTAGAAVALLVATALAGCLFGGDDGERSDGRGTDGGPHPMPTPALECPALAGVDALQGTITVQGKAQGSMTGDGTRTAFDVDVLVEARLGLEDHAGAHVFASDGAADAARLRIDIRFEKESGEVRTMTGRAIDPSLMLWTVGAVPGPQGCTATGGILNTPGPATFTRADGGETQSFESMGPWSWQVPMGEVADGRIWGAGDVPLMDLETGETVGTLRVEYDLRRA